MVVSDVFTILAYSCGYDCSGVLKSLLLYENEVELC